MQTMEPFNWHMCIHSFVCLPFRANAFLLQVLAHLFFIYSFVALNICLLSVTSPMLLMWFDCIVWLIQNLNFFVFVLKCSFTYIMKLQKWLSLLPYLPQFYVISLQNTWDKLTNGILWQTAKWQCARCYFWSIWTAASFSMCRWDN